MKKQFGFILLTSFFSTGLFAKDILEQKLVNKLQNSNQLDKLRVYVSSTLKVDYESELDDQTNTDRDVTRVVKKKLLREKVKSNVRGKILETETFSRCLDNRGCRSSDFLRLHVTFDPDCKDISCSYQFERKHTLSEDVRTGAKYYEHRIDKNAQKFFITKAPDRDSLKFTEINKEVFLEYRYKEINEVDRSRRNLPGVD
jgi:hypothetical protein